MMRSGRKIALKALDAAKVMIMIVLVTALAAQSGIFGGERTPKAFAQTATSSRMANEVGTISQFNDGTYVHDFTESVLGVNGEVAFCMDPNIGFRPGTVSSTDIRSMVTQAQLTDIALRAHFARNIYCDNHVSDNARVILAQTLIWEVLSPSQSFVVIAAEDGGRFPEVTAAVRNDLCAKARAFAKANLARYDSYGTLWTNGSTQPVATFGCQLAVGTIDLTKRSSNPSVSDSNACYSLESATYGVFSDAACTAKQATMTTNSSGYAKSDELRVGTYYIQEISAPAGFALDSTVYPVTVIAGQTSHVGDGTVKDAPLVRAGIASIGKHDAEMGWQLQPGAALGGATLERAIYEIAHYGGSFASADEAIASGEPLAKWEFATDADGKIDMDHADEFLQSGTLYRDGDGNVVFPLGTYVIREADPSEGYLISEDRFLVRVEQASESANMVGDFREQEGSEWIVAPEQVKRCDLALTKVREADMTRLAGIPFTLTSDTTGESHIVVTDENGRIDTSSSWNRHASKTNANDQAIDHDGNLQEDKLDPSAGIWFGLQPNGETTNVNDALGALPYDTYTLQELSCSANAGLELVRMSGIIAKRDSVSVDLGTVDDREAQLPAIDTVAYDASDQDKLVAAGKAATVKDDVELSNLVPGRSYTLYGTVIDAETGLPALVAPQEEYSDDLDGEAEYVQEFWDGLVELLGAKRSPSINGFAYEIDTSRSFDAESLAGYLSEHESIASNMLVASMSFEADSPHMITALDYEMDASEMKGDYVIFDLLTGDDGSMAIHADTNNDQESFTVEQPEPAAAGKGYYKTGNGVGLPWGASGTVAVGTALGGGLFLARRFGWSR